GTADAVHVPAPAPLSLREPLLPPGASPPARAVCQAVLLPSAKGARALAEASDRRGRPILAVGDTTAATAEGLGFTSVTSASGDGAALAERVRERLGREPGPLVPVGALEVGFGRS